MASSMSFSTNIIQPHHSDLNSSCKLNVMSHSVNPVLCLLGSNTKKFNRKEQGDLGILRSHVLFRFIYTCQKSLTPLNPNRLFPTCSYLSMSSSVASNHVVSESMNLEVGADKCSQIDSFVRILHKSARSFSVAVKHHESVRNSTATAKSWVGIDAHAWHKHLAYQVAVYALLKTVIESNSLPSDEHKDFSLVQAIISPKISKLLEIIESQLSTRDPNLVEWFKTVKLPLLSGLFIPLVKRWSLEHEISLHAKTSSGTAVIFLAIGCCVAIGKLGAERISCPTFTITIRKIAGELLDISYGRAPMDTLHILAYEAGVEQEFLSHFGAKLLPNREGEELSFWIGMAQKKLSLAFQRESVISRMKNFHDKQGLERDLATLGLFAFLGSKTRLFLSKMGIKDLDEQLKNFLSYLECGSLFIYPEFSSLPVYQLFMEVVTDEIGWLDLYAAVPGISHHERRRSKQHAIQAEKEIILSAVFSVCSDMFSGFTHFNISSQQSLDAKVDEFLFRSRNMLTICLEDYWAAYCRSGELLKYTGIFIPQRLTPLGKRRITDVTSLTEAQRNFADLVTLGAQFTPQPEPESSNLDGTDAITILEVPCSPERKPAYESMFKNYINKLISMTSDILMGTRLLFIDISFAMGFLLKQIRGHMLTQREKKKLKRTLVDFASVIPVTILMLLPVSAIGHAAMLAGIKKYIPCLIPSPYSSERLDVVKQLNRIKRMEVESWGNV